MIAWLTQLAIAACTVFGPATVHLPTGAVYGQMVLVDNGRIVRVAANETTDPKGCTRFDTRNGHLTAGIIEVGTQLGLVEIGLETATHDDDAGGDAVRAAIRTVDGFNPDSVPLTVARKNGITTALVHPTGGRISGPAPVMNLGVGPVSALVVRETGAMVANLGGSSSAQALLELREIFAASRDFRTAKRTGHEQDQLAVWGAGASDLRALFPVLDGTVPLWLSADRRSDIEAVVAFAASERVKVILVGAAEGWRVAPLLAKAGIPVVIDPLLVGPGGFDQTSARADNAALLMAAGVPVVFSTFSTHQARTLPQVAANAVRAGVSEAQALAAITSTPAVVLGLGDRGKIATGAVADLVWWNRNPLGVEAVPLGVWINGVAQPLETRQDALLKRYRTLPGNPAAPLPLPGVP